MSSVRARNSGPALTRSLAGALVCTAVLVWTGIAGAAPSGQLGGRGTPSASVSYLRVSPGGGLFGGPVATAYVQAFDGADPPVGRTALAGLPSSAFSVAVDGK